MFYSLDKRPGVKAINPTFGVGKLAQRLAEHWRVMNTSEREPYEVMARKDKERYESDLKAYKQGLYSPMERRILVATPTVPQAIVKPVEGEEEKGETGTELTGASDSQDPSELEQLCELYQ